MLYGIISAIVVTVAWVLIQVGVMHVKPAKVRFKAMLVGYLVSLPFVYVMYRWCAACPCLSAFVSGEEAWLMGLFHAYVLHLLLFFLYVECFYHVERSVSLRILVEILADGAQGSHRDKLQGEYNLSDMVAARLVSLEENNYIAARDGHWHLKPKGKLFATVMQFSAWVFQSKSQWERT